MLRANSLAFLRAFYLVAGVCLFLSGCGGEASKTQSASKMTPARCAASGSPVRSLDVRPRWRVGDRFAYRLDQSTTENSSGLKGVSLSSDLIVASKTSNGYRFELRGRPAESKLVGATSGTGAEQAAAAEVLRPLLFADAKYEADSDGYITGVANQDKVSDDVSNAVGKLEQSTAEVSGLGALIQGISGGDTSAIGVSQYSTVHDVYGLKLKRGERSHFRDQTQIGSKLVSRQFRISWSPPSHGQPCVSIKVNIVPNQQQFDAAMSQLVRESAESSGESIPRGKTLGVRMRETHNYLVDPASWRVLRLDTKRQIILGPSGQTRASHVTLID